MHDELIAEYAKLRRHLGHAQDEIDKLKTQLADALAAADPDTNQALQEARCMREEAARAADHAMIELRQAELMTESTNRRRAEIEAECNQAHKRGYTSGFNAGIYQLCDRVQNLARADVADLVTHLAEELEPADHYDD